MDIFLVRHGEAAASWSEAPDPGLSERGREEAAAASRELLPRLAAGTRLFSSPLARARETAEPLARELQAQVTVDDVFREVPSPVGLDQRQAWLRAFMQQSWAEQGDDLLAWRDNAVARLSAMTSPVVVFTHFLVINAVAGQAVGHADTLYFWPANGSVTHLSLTGGELSLVALGEQLDSHIN